MPDYENQASVSNSIEILNEVNFESEESILLDQTTLSTLNYDSNVSSVTDNKTFWKTQVRSRGGGGRGKGGGLAPCPTKISSICPKQKGCPF